MTTPIPAILVNTLSNNDDDGSTIALSSNSLNSSIFNYRRLHGRPYKSSPTTEYWTPIDAAQNEAFDLLHNVQLMITDNKLSLSPISPTDSFELLDVGTGTGTWAIDFAD